MTNTTDASMFDFGSMVEAIGADPFADKTNKFAKDERFYTLAKDKETGKGAAIIRFLPDSEKGIIQKLFKIQTTVTKNGKKRFVSEYSPSSIGQPCPFQEEWQTLWNSGDKEGSKLFGRGQRFITNIKVLKDPANKENEGKIFLFDMSATMKDKIQHAMNPSDQDRDLGAEPKELFNPLRGHSFKLASSKGSNGIINYDASEVISEVTSIYDTVEEALTDIKENTYKLSDFLKPESFLSYDELVKKKAWVTFSEVETVQPLAAEAAEVTQTVAEVQPAVQPAVQPSVSNTTEVPQEAQVEKTETKTETKPGTTPETKTENKEQELNSLLDGLM